MKMNAKLMTGVLLVGLMSSTQLYAASGAKGDGCALAKEGSSVNVTALLNKDVVNQYHGNLVAGDTITRTVNFAYDLDSQIDANCAYGLLELSLENRKDGASGPIELSHIYIKNDNGETLADGLDKNQTAPLGKNSKGKVTLDLEYKVKEPDKLAETFSYENSFDLILTAKKGTNSNPE
ncbi:hypothetical protein [Thiothrix lacustris]|uniref:hypothetical protein n=1 Tax=Thiothrix lacustris TaxID=525917 RepID=UPI0027E55C11|nr:hypothetical protein [Thiothrix lacustris]WMP19237.1 hypothetical protein RCS87_09355 [Thiothrix lacustris]